MSLDKEKIRFNAKLITAAMRLNASVGDPEAKGFKDQLYDEWRASGSPLEQCSAWLDSRLAGLFIAYLNPPLWVEEEPAWPFHEGKPMVFLCQTSMDNSFLSQKALSPGETIYVFAIRQEVKSGFRMVYRVVSQFI